MKQYHFFRLTDLVRDQQTNVLWEMLVSILVRSTGWVKVRVLIQVNFHSFVIFQVFQ